MRFFLYLLLAAALLLGGGAHAQEFSGAQVSSANMVRGAASSTSNTAVTLIAAPATGVRLYITGLQCYNSGATTSTITLGGREFTRIDYGDGGSMSYVTTDGDIVIVIETSDADLATQAAAALP